MVSNLIVARFDDAHSAFLARAALARMQKEFSLPGRNLAVVTREAGEEIALQESVGLTADSEMHATYWRRLLSLLLVPPSSTAADTEAAMEKLEAMGIDAAFRSHLSEEIRAGTSALFVLVTEPTMRDKVLGLLRGFQGQIMQAELASDDRKL